MVSRENAVTGGFVLAALVLAYGGFLLTDVSDSILVAVLLVVGVVVPTIVNQWLGGGASI